MLDELTTQERPQRVVVFIITLNGETKQIAEVKQVRRWDTCSGHLTCSCDDAVTIFREWGFFIAGYEKGD